jgi:hypothetical protein
MIDRELEEITEEEIEVVNKILAGEYYYGRPLTSARDIEYQCFTKSHAIYSGRAVVEVHQYLCSVGISVVEDKFDPCIVRNRADWQQS